RRWIGRERPHLGPGRGVAGVEPAIAGAEVHPPAVVEQRRRVDDLAGEQLPAHLARRRERVEGAIGGADEDVAVAVDDGRAEDALPGGERPQAAAARAGPERASPVPG